MDSFLQNSLQFYQQVKSSVFCRDNDWQKDQGVYRGDCSGFFLQLLEQFKPALLQDLTRQYGPRAKAFQIYDWLQTPQANITLKSQIDTVAPGDILAWRKLKPPKSGDTGHLALVIAVEAKSADGLLQRVKVMDLSKQAHDHDDRARPGLACGWMQLSADSSGAVNGYTWSSEINKAKRTAVVIAHIS